MQDPLSLLLQELKATSSEADAFSLAKDPEGFCREFLGVELTTAQAEIAQSLVQDRFVAVESGHAVGKTFLAASISLWWLTTRQPAVVVSTAPTWNQVAQQLWRTMRHLFHASVRPLPGRFYETPRWEIDDDRFAIGISTKKQSDLDVTTIQGYHSPHLLAILDEAAGLPRNLWEAITSLVTGSENRLLAIGNPVGQVGPFWEACNSPLYRHFRLSCLEHPNVVSGREVVPGAVSRSWVEERLEQWANECPQGTPGAIYIPWQQRWYLPQPIFKARVLGQAPEEREDQLISLRLVEAAQMLWSELTPGDPLIIGLDPARYGSSRSVAALRAGRKILWVQRREGQDLTAVAGWAIHLFRETGASLIRVDEAGLGAGVVDILRQEGMPVDGVLTHRGALANQRFANLRSEIWWRMRTLLQRGLLALPPDDLLAAELTAPRYSFDHFGRVALEDKAITEKRLGHSPDAADAVALTLTEPRDIQDDEGRGASEQDFGPILESRWRLRENERPGIWSARLRGKSRWRRT